MNIAIVLDALLDQSVGSIVSTLRFTDRLRQKGHTIIFIAARYPHRPAVDSFLGYKVYRFRSIMLPRSEKKFFIAFPLPSEIQHILETEHVDILHIMMPTLAAIASIKAAKKCGIKIVVHSHTQPENLFTNLPKLFNNHSINALFYKYLMSIYRKADIVICPSSFAEKVLHRYDPHLKTVVISNGVDLSFFRKVNPDSFLEKFHLSKKDKKLLFVGRLHPEKNVAVLIKAMPFLLKELKNVTLLVVGAGYLEDSLKALSKRLGLEKKIRFLGRIGNEDLLRAYNACDLFVLTSLAELEGMVVLEAMACGKPILVSNSKQSASPSFVKENGLTFNPYDARDLAVKALRMLKNDKTLRFMGEKSSQYIKDYGIDKSVRLLEEVYTSISDE